MLTHKTFLKFISLKVVSLCLILVCMANRCAAQMDTVLKPGTDTVLILHLIDSGQKSINPATDIKIYDKPLQLSINGNYTFGILRSLNSIARIYITKNDFDSVIFTYNKALSYCKMPRQRARFLSYIGEQYLRHADLTNAAEKFYAALSELSHDTTYDRYSTLCYLGTYGGLAQVYLCLGDDKNETYYFNVAEALARKSHEYASLSATLSNKGNYFIQHKMLDSAGILYREAATVVRDQKIKSRESDIGVALGWYEIYCGEYEKNRGEVEKARSAFEKAMDYFRQAIDTSALNYNLRPDRVKMVVSYGMGDALRHLGKYEQAEAILLPAVARANEKGMDENIADAYLVLSDIYRATGRYKKALEYMDSVTTIKDSLASEQKRMSVAQLEINHRLAEKDKQLSLNKLLIAQQQNKIARKDLWTAIVSAILLLGVLLAVGVYLSISNKAKSLARENKIHVLKASITGGDDERTRIARELHDGIGGMLSAAMMRFSSMHHENAEIAHTTAYNDTMEILREMGDEIRKTAHNLMPEVLLKQSLPEAVRVFCNNVQEDGALKIDFQSYGSFDCLTQGQKLNLYRIVQELIKNSTVHSRANHLLVQLMQNKNKLIVSVEDNGIGFNENEIKGGIGLHNIRTRVSSMDGLFTLESKPGKGTTIIIELEVNYTAVAEENVA